MGRLPCTHLTKWTRERQRACPQLRLLALQLLPTRQGPVPVAPRSVRTRTFFPMVPSHILQSRWPAVPTPRPPPPEGPSEQGPSSPLSPGPHAQHLCHGKEPAMALLSSKVGPLRAARSPQTARFTSKFHQTIGYSYPEHTNTRIHTHMHVLRTFHLLPLACPPLGHSPESTRGLTYMTCEWTLVLAESRRVVWRTDFTSVNL